MTQENITFSVLMAVYNGADTVEKAVKSILAQSMRDFEFIIINDGSTDRTGEILDNLAGDDDRLKIHHQQNTGLTIALNRGLKLAKGRYIARQDADDISYPDRFEKQLAILEGDPAVVLVGGNADDLYADGSRGQWGAYSPQELAKVTFMKTPFPHSTVMMRAETVRALGGYDESYKTAQDMELWMRMARAGKLAMVQEPVIQRFIAPDSISVKRRWRQTYDGMRARLKHAPVYKKPLALYHTFRSLMIGLVLHYFIKR